MQRRRRGMVPGSTWTEGTSVVLRGMAQAALLGSWRLVFLLLSFLSREHLGVLGGGCSSFQTLLLCLNRLRVQRSLMFLFPKYTQSRTLPGHSFFCVFSEGLSHVGWNLSIRNE